jgi:hypothetical protein
MQPTHPAFIVGVNRVMANTHDLEMHPPAFDREIAYAFLGRDKGPAALLRRHGRAHFL